MDSNEIWNEFLSRIKTKVSLMSYNYLFKDLKLYSYENSKMIIIVPSNELLLQNITKNYTSIIQELIDDITNDTCEIEYIFERDVSKLEQKKAKRDDILNKDNDESINNNINNYKYISNFNQKYTFEVFAGSIVLDSADEEIKNIFNNSNYEERNTEYKNQAGAFYYYSIEEYNESIFDEYFK